MQILAKIGSDIAKVDFPMILFDFYVYCSELSFKKDSEILIQQKTWNSHFSPFPLILDVYIALNTNRQVGSFGHFEWSANLIWYIVLVAWKILKFHHIRSNKNKENAFFWHFRLSQVYAYLRKPIVKQVLRSFLGVKQLSTTSDSRYTIHNFGRFCAKFCPKKWVSPTFWTDH